MQTKYQPLIDYLVASTEPLVWLTFEEIEQILQAALPPTARTGTGFWTQAGSGHVHGWQARGWRAHVARRRAFVIFMRDAKEA